MTQLIFAKNSSESKKLSRLCRQNKIRRLHHGVYTNNLEDPFEKIASHHWMELIAHLVPKGVLSFRTAFDLRPTPFQGQLIVFVTSNYVKTLLLPGLMIKVLKGDHESYLEQVLPNISRSNMPRMLLENLTVSKKAEYKGIKTVGIEAVENILAKELQLRHEKGLNQLRDEAKVIAEKLGLKKEYSKLTKIISVLLSTYPDGDFIQSDYAKAVAKKEPYDSKRIKLFEDLSIALKKMNWRNRVYTYSKTSFRNMTFFESYFSNFIEGTEFIIDEAEEIIFQGNEISNRHADSHDVLANSLLSNDYTEMAITPSTPNELINLLQERHAYLMKERCEKNPGKFKIKPNKAGNTHFVLPNEVMGTLYQGFQLYRLQKEGLEKALFMHFLISEVHPFDDGNGRLARIMMNAELVKAGLYKIIIPIVHRDNYLNGLRLASRDHDFRIYCETLDQAQAYTASINWSDYGEARQKIEEECANVTPDEGLPIFNRALRKLDLSRS